MDFAILVSPPRCGAVLPHVVVIHTAMCPQRRYSRTAMFERKVRPRKLDTLTEMRDWFSWRPPNGPFLVG